MYLSPFQLPFGAGPQDRHSRAPRQGAQVGGGRRPQEEVRGQGQNSAQRAGKINPDTIQGWASARGPGLG